MPDSTSISNTSRLHDSIHPSINAAQVSELVEQFYQRAHANDLLGPVFATQTTADWEVHLRKMKAFWRSVLLKTGEYKGKPVPIHQRLEGITTRHFEVWLALFSSTCSEVFTPEAAPLVHSAAKRIATSLWLSRSSDPFATLPDWSEGSSNLNSPNP